MHIRGVRTLINSLAFVFVAFLCCQCNIIHSVTDENHTVDVAKPRVHKSWYKKSRWHKRLHIGKYQLRVFEKSGVKKVKMRS